MTTMFTRTRLHVTLYVDDLSCSSSVYRHTVTQIPVQTNAVRYRSRHSGDRRECKLHSPALFRRTTHLRPIYFLALPCTTHSPSYRVLGAQQLWHGGSTDGGFVCDTSVMFRDTLQWTFYLSLLPILISGGEESLEPRSHVTSKRQVHGSRHLLQRGAASSTGWCHNTDEPSQTV